MRSHHIYLSNTTELPTWALVLIFVVLPIIFIVLWFIYYNNTKFTKVIKVADKFMKTHQVGDLHVSSNHRNLTTEMHNTRRTVEEYFLLDTDRNIYNVGDCLLCGFYVGSFGKYARVVPGDTIEIMGYGGYFTGIADIYSIRRLN
jgi:hypothetical protein